MKKCSKCGEEKPTTEFHRHKRTKDNLNSWCKTCVKEYSHNWHKRNSWVYERKRDQHLQRRYGITMADKERMAQDQEGRCYICKEVKPLNVDHCHTHGHVRALLCTDCNQGLGFFNDNTELLEIAIKYLEKFKHGHTAL